MSTTLVPFIIQKRVNLSITDFPTSLLWQTLRFWYETPGNHISNLDFLKKLVCEKCFLNDDDLDFFIRLVSFLTLIHLQCSNNLKSVIEKHWSWSEGRNNLALHQSDGHSEIWHCPHKTCLPETVRLAVKPWDLASLTLHCRNKMLLCQRANHWDSLPRTSRTMMLLTLSLVIIFF